MSEAPFPFLDADSNHRAADRTLSFDYDAASRMLSAGDSATGSTPQYVYVYDGAGRVKQTTINVGVPEVILTDRYDGNGFRTGLTATISGADDFQDAFTPDNLGRMVRAEQSGAVGGNPVAEKRVDFAYRGDSQLETITRYKDRDGGIGNEVAASTYGYDYTGRLTALTYTHHAALAPVTLRAFGWSYDAASRVISHDSDIDAEDTTSYGYDDAGQLTSADYTDVGRSDESFNYDENGNRIGSNNGQTYGTSGEGNRLTTDGVHRYRYDVEGNLITRFVDDGDEQFGSNDKDVTEYTYDNRNRLTGVVHRELFDGSANWAVDYQYDVFNRRIARTVDANGDDAGGKSTEQYVWDGPNVVLDFADADGPGGTATPELARRYLWGEAVDQLLAQETVDNGGAGNVSWPLSDNLGSTRSLVDSNGQITATYTYDTFGAVTVRQGNLSDTRFLFTGQEYDLATGLYYMNARWYDPATGKFTVEDPIGYRSGDPNAYRYVGNRPIELIDPTGTTEERDPPTDPEPAVGGVFREAHVLTLPDKLLVLRSDDDPTSEANWRKLAPNAKVVTVSSKDDVMKEINKAENGSFDGIALSGHKLGSGVRTKCNPILREDFTDKELLQIGDKLTEDGMFYYLACNGGLGAAQKWADKVRKPAVSPTSDVDRSIYSDGSTALTTPEGHSWRIFDPERWYESGGGDF